MVIVLPFALAIGAIRRPLTSTSTYILSATAALHVRGRTASRLPPARSLEGPGGGPRAHYCPPLRAPERFALGAALALLARRPFIAPFRFEQRKAFDRAAHCGRKTVPQRALEETQPLQQSRGGISPRTRTVDSPRVNSRERDEAPHRLRAESLAPVAGCRT